jgi:predicted Rossmann fold nucleotide-binding protein DprA/Smf involved in DNA uptake
MSEEMSGDTQAILLLCGRLGQTKGDAVAKPLTPKQYSVLARWLLGRSMRPANLLSNEGREQLRELQIAGLDSGMVESLLDRGGALGLMTERWTSRGLWVISRGDSSYPVRFKNYLGNAAPPLLFGAGKRELLQLGGLAVVGSRDASAEEVEYARMVGSACAAQRIAVISGGAPGIDIESMAACFEAGGSAIGILADSLARHAVSARYRDGLISDRLVLVSPYDPEARWFAHTAMERNKLIYGLSDAALVVTSAAENGGTWSGATEALKCARVSIYVRAAGTLAEGNRKLLARGAKPFPVEPWDDLRSLFSPPPGPSGNVPPTDQHASTTELTSPPPERGPDSGGSPAGDVYTIVLPALLATLAQPKAEKAVEESLGLVPAQVKAWLKRACEEGRVRKLNRPVLYVAVEESTLLFGGVQGNTGGSPANGRS